MNLSQPIFQLGIMFAIFPLLQVEKRYRFRLGDFEKLALIRSRDSLISTFFFCIFTCLLCYCSLKRITGFLSLEFVRQTVANTYIVNFNDTVVEIAHTFIIRVC